MFLLLGNYSNFHFLNPGPGESGEEKFKSLTSSEVSKQHHKWKASLRLQLGIEKTKKRK